MSARSLILVALLSLGGVAVAQAAGSTPAPSPYQNVAAWCEKHAPLCSTFVPPGGTGSGGSASGSGHYGGGAYDCKLKPATLCPPDGDGDGDDFGK